MPVRIIDIVGTACRVLKCVVVRHSPRVHRVNFTQCAKLKHEKMIDEVCTNPPERSRLIVIRPMQNVSVMAHFHQRRRTRIRIQSRVPNPIVTLYYAQLFPLARIRIPV